MVIEDNKQEVLEMYRDFSAKFCNRVLNVLNEQANHGENISLSPSRLQTVLVLLANWAAPNIRRAILDVVGSDVMDLREANLLCNKELLKVTPYNASHATEHDVPIIEQQTTLWVQNQLKVNESAIETAKSEFDVVLKSVNFKDPRTKSIIDKVIEQLTHGLIKQLESELKPETLALLTDILYFKAKWDDPFEESSTKDQLFYGTGGKKLVPTMKKTDFMRYGETSKCQIVSLRYQCLSEEDKSFSMRIFLPKKGVSIYDVLHERWSNEFYLDLEEEEIRLSLPRFTIESKIKAKDLLKEMGLDCIFESKDIIPGCVKNLRIEDIIQQVKIKVNENETEAAAVTYTILAAGCPPMDREKPITMTVNRPFIFEIAEDYSDTILFAGIINNIKE